MKTITTTIVLYVVTLVLPLHISAQQQVPILIYHSIDEFKGLGDKELYVTPENFEKQMRYLRDNGFTLLTFEQWQNLDNVEKPIFITFDDGYKNNLNAFAILKSWLMNALNPRLLFL